MTFKTTSEILIYSIDAIELNIDKNSYSAISEMKDTLHILDGEFLYCDLLLDAKLIVTEKQLDEILQMQNISIHKVVDSIIYIHSLTEKNRKLFNDLKKQATRISIEDIDTEDEYYVFILL